MGRMTMANGHEIELKLAATPLMLARLKQLDSLQADSRHKQFSTVYYDTPDRRLAAAHLALRVRDDGSSFEITLKRAAAGKAVARAEWSALMGGAVADGEPPDLGALPPDAVHLVTAAAKGVALGPVFSLAIEREVRTLSYGRSQIELAFDQGQVTVGAKAQPVCELELELMSGTLKDLLGLARALPLGPDLYWSITSKSALGYRLADGGAPVAVKARPVRLPVNSGTRAALRHVVWASVSQFLSNMDAVTQAGLSEGLHQMRVSLRRLRVALRLGHGLLGDPDVPVLDAEWGAAIGQMGTARDLDVILARLGKAADGGEASIEVQQALTQERAEAYAAVVRLVQSAAFQHLLVGTVHWAEQLGPSHPDDAPLDEAARALLKSWRRKLRHKSADLADLSPEARHRVRIGLKRLRYAMEFFTSLSRDPTRKTLDRLRLDRLADAQEHLGDLNDLDVSATLGARLNGDPIHRAAILEALTAANRDRRRDVPKLLTKAQDAVDVALAKRKTIKLRASAKQR